MNLINEVVRVERCDVGNGWTGREGGWDLMEIVSRAATRITVRDPETNERFILTQRGMDETLDSQNQISVREEVFRVSW